MNLSSFFSLLVIFSLLFTSSGVAALPVQAAPVRITAPAAIADVMQRINDKWLADHPDPGDAQWARAAYFTGNMAHYAMSGNDQYLAYSQRWAEQHNWQLNGGCTTVYADNQTAGQTYLDLFDLRNDAAKVACITQSIQQSMSWASVEIDLGAVQRVNQIRLYPLNNRAYRYYVQTKTSADGAYTQVVNRAGNSEASAVLTDTFAPLEARFVRVWFIGAYGYIDNWVSIHEIAIFGDTSPDVNLALGRSVTCSSQPEVENPCNNLVDDNLTSRWSAAFPAAGGEGSMNWWWIDALYMAMPVYARLGRLSGDPTYGEVMYARYQDAKIGRRLYDVGDGLWHRDGNYLYPAAQTPAGKKVYWSRGNGWVFAAHARMLDALPATDPHRPEYEETFRAMAAALKARQHADGYWNASLADPAHFPGPESSGTAFFTFGLAWGVNQGLLARSEYEATIFKGWNWLADQALHPDGVLGYVQPIGGEPAAAGYNDTGDYGVGALLLAGSEIHRLILASERLHSNYLPVVTKRSGLPTAEKVLFELQSPCQIERVFTSDPSQASAVGPSCQLTAPLSVGDTGILRLDGPGGLIIDLAALKDSAGQRLAAQPSSFYRVEVTLADAGQSDVWASIGVVNAGQVISTALGTQGLAVGIKETQHTYWFSSTQLIPPVGEGQLDAESQAFLTKFDVGKRQRPTTGSKDVPLELYVTPLGSYAVIDGVNWASFPTLAAGSFTLSPTTEPRYLVVRKWDQGNSPVQFKSLKVVQLDSEIGSVDEVNAHFIRRTVEKLLPQIPIAPSECRAKNGAANSTNALMQAWLYRAYDHYLGTDHRNLVRSLVDSYLQNLPTCVDQVLRAYASARQSVYDCAKTPNEQLGTIMWVNHGYINYMHTETRAMYALSGYLTADQLARFQNSFGRLIDASMSHIRANGTFPAAGNCHVDDTFAEEISWLLMTYAGYYALFPNDGARSAKLIDQINFLGFIHFSDGRTINEVFPTLNLGHLGNAYRNFRSRYTYINNSVPTAPSDGYLDNHGFHPSLHYAIGIIESAALARNLLARRGIGSAQTPTLTHNMALLYRDSILGYLDFKTLRHARPIPNPRLGWCYEQGPQQRDRYLYNADRSVITLFNGCSTPSGVEDWASTFVNYGVAAIYGDEENALPFARAVYYLYYPGSGELYCSVSANRCSTDPILYTYVLDTMAFATDSTFVP